MAIDETGHLSLQWTKKSVRGNSTYEAYLLELEPTDATYAFSSAMVKTPPLLLEEISVAYSDSPFQKGTKVISVTELSATLADTLKSDRKYLLQLVEKNKVPKTAATVMLLQVDFNTNVPTSAVATNGSITLNWAAVAGANHYEVYADKGLTILLGESDVNELILSTGNGKIFQDYYIRPMRGELASKALLHIVMNQSTVTVEKVRSVTPDGRYTIGDTLEFIVDFSDVVTIFGDTSLPLKTSNLIRQAEYVSGSGTKSLHFQYAVQAGDDTLQLETDAVLGGTYTDAQGLSVGAALPASGHQATLKELSVIAIDTLPPTAPLSPGFNVAVTASGAFTLSWGAGSDLYFKDHSVKLCSAADCSTNCSAETSTSGTSQNFSGITEGSYYGCVRSNDDTGLKSAWVSSLQPVTVDTTGPLVARVYGASANGVYKEGQSVQIAVQFNEVVHAFGTGDIQLHLETGMIDRDAVYSSGSGSDTLIFSYTIQTGDAAADLNYMDPAALDLGASGQIKDSLGNLATVTLPLSGAANALASQSAIVIDTEAPTAPSAVHFPAALSATTALSVLWSDSSDANFKQHNLKLCTSNDCSTGCLTAASAAASPGSLTGLDGGIYFACVQGEDLVGHQSAWSVSAATMEIDALPPSVVEISSTTANGVYKEGQSLDLTLQFSEAVTVTNGPELKLRLGTGAPDHDAVYASGSGTNILTFTYGIQAGDETPDLNYLTTTALSVGNGSIKDAAGHDATLTLPDLTGAHSLATLRDIAIDTTAPSNPSAVAFASAFNNTTSLSVNWTASSDSHFAQHNLKLCSAADCSTSCISDTTASSSPATLNGVDGESYYACVQGEDSLGHLSAWIASAATASIDMTAPTVSDVTSSTADGRYTTGDVIAIQVTFSKALSVTNPGDLSLRLATTPATREAIYASGDGTDTLTFQYTVSASDTATDLQYDGTNALGLGASGTIKDAAGNNANLTLPALVDSHSLASHKDLVIDTTPPSNPSSVGFGTSLTNSTSFDMSWSDSTDSNFSTHHAKLCSANDCVTGCTAEIAAPASPQSMTGVNGATYYGCVQGEDLLGLKSDWVSSVATIFVDANNPSVIDVTSTIADGAYKAGAIIPITITFSKVVYLTTPADLGLLLETGTTDQKAIYVSGDGSDTLIFEYTVQAGDTAADLNYQSMAALTLGTAGLIKDLAGSAADRTLPAIGSAHSLAFQKAIQIDTTAPAAPVITSPADASYNTAAVSTVSGTSEADATIELKSGGTVIGTTTASGTSWTMSLGSALSDGNYTLTATATDAAGNVSAASTGNSFSVDTSAPTPPVIAALTTPTLDTTPTVSGTAEANMIIKVYADADLVGTVTADGSGHWSLATSVLSDANYSITATATDPGSRSSAASAAVALSIDTTNPTDPIGASFAGTLTNSTSIPMTWTNSSDAHFKQHNVKLCAAADCSTSCISESTSPASPATLLGVDTGTYYGCVQGEDELGHTSAWLATPATIHVDATEATVISVTSSTADGVYTTGQNLAITVTFSKTVNVSNGGDLRLSLETGTTDHDASYVSGDGTATLLFGYTVQAGDTSDDLNYQSTTALSLGATGLIKDAANNAANLTLPPLMGSSSIAGQKAIRLDTTAPTEASSVGFSGTIVNTTSFDMTWAAGTDTNLDHYNATLCAAADCSTSCTAPVSSAILSASMTGTAGQTYYGCVQTVDAVGLTSAWVNSTGTMTIDTTAPTVSDITSSLADGSYKAGQVVPIQVSFSEPVYVQGGSDVKLKLETGTSDQFAVYSSGTGTAVLTFNYTVMAGDSSTDLNYVDTASLTITPSGSIQDEAGSHATLTLPALADAHSLGSQKALVIDTTAPAAPVIVLPADNAYSMTAISTVSGISEANAVITLKSGATTIGTTTASGTNWSITLGTALSDGVYSLTATATDAAGNISVASSANSVTVDTSGPNAPLVTALTTPSSNPTPTVAGTSEPNMSITVYADGVSVGSTTASGTGNWSLTSSALADATYAITATATDPGSRVSAASNAVAYNVDTTNPSVPSTIVFSSPYSSSTSLDVSWTASSDVNFKQHNAKLCTLADCSTNCTAEVAATGTSTTLTGVNGTTYYACVQGEDLLAHTSAWVASAGTARVDTSVPTVTSVSSLTANGAYTVGATVAVDVVFSEAVTVTNTADLSLLMETGTTDRQATYSSGDGTTTLTFTYAVQAGDTSDDLDYGDTTALSKGATGTIKDLAGNNAVLTLAAPGSAGSLGHAKAIIIDTTAPTSPGSPSFAVSSTNSSSFALSWSASSDTNFSLYNTKICSAADCTTSCIDPQTSSSLSQTKTGTAGSVYYGCVQGQDTAGNLSAWAPTATAITIDTTPPTVSNVTSTKADGSYKAGVSIPITITFSKDVTVGGTGVGILLETGTTDQRVLYSSGSGSNTLTFNYVVQAGDSSADLGYNSTASLTLGSGTIKDAAGNDATLILPAQPGTGSLATNKAIIIDTTAPAAPVITSPADAAYSMTQVTVVSGTSEANALITIKDGGSTIDTVTADGSGLWSKTLTAALTDGSHTLTATASDAATNVSSASSTHTITVATSAPTAPVLSAFTTPINSATPTFSGTSEPNVTITLYQGATAIGTTTASGAGTWSLASSTLSDGSYTITAKATDPGLRTSGASNARSITIDTVAPTVSSVNSTLANGTYGMGTVVPVTVNFSEAVTVTATPTLVMEAGTSDPSASYVSGSGSTALLFQFTVASGHITSDLSYVGTTSLAGTIKDAAGNAATLTLPAPGAANSLSSNKAIVIDGVGPAISFVTSPNTNGSYGQNNDIDIVLTFTKNITVTGTPLLALNTSPAKNAAFLSSSGATATFRYTVASGDTSADLEYASTAALSLNGGTIRGPLGNDATLTLPTIATANSLGGNKNLVIVGNSAIPVLTVNVSASDAYVGTAITPVNVDNTSTGNDQTNDARAITYTCKFDTTVNGTMDAGGTNCSSLPTAATFTASTGVLTWTPTSAANASYTAIANYEFLITGTTNANTSASKYFTVRVIRPWTTTIGFDPGTAASYTFDSDLINHTGGTVSLLAKDQLDAKLDLDWAGTNNGAGRANNPYYILKTGSYGSCAGQSVNCFGLGNASWVPRTANLIRNVGFEGANAATQLSTMDPGGPTVPTQVQTERKTWYSSAYFDGGDELYSARDINDDFTVNLWIKTTETTGEAGCTAFSNGVGLVTTEMNGVLNDWGISLCDGYIVAGVGSASPSFEKSIKSKYLYNDNSWHMITFTRVKSSGAIKLYVDALLQGTETGGTASLTASTYIWYGKHQTKGFGGGYGYLGYMDEISMWTVALTDSEIQTVYDRQVPRNVGSYDSRIMDAGYAAAPWTSLTIPTTQPQGKELPDNAVSETTTDYDSISSGLMSGIKALWHLNETSGNFTDRSGMGNSVGSSIAKGFPGRFGRTIYFDGTTNHLNLGPDAASSFGTGSFSSSFWIKTSTTYATPGRIFTNGYYNGDSGWYLRITDRYANFGIGCTTGSASNCVSIKGNTPINNGQWHHIMTVADRSTSRVRLYVDGKQETITKEAHGTCGTISGKDLSISGCTALNANRTLDFAYFGVHDNWTEYYEGYMDEIAMWNRALSASEVLQVYRRGGNRYLVQVRTCTSANCSDDPNNLGWKGPDGTIQSYFSEINNNSAPTTLNGTVATTALKITFADYGLTLTGRYFQYRVILESDDVNTLCNYGSAETCSPEIRSVTVAPDHYPIAPTISYNTATPYYNVNSLTEALGGAGCTTGVRYQLSLNNSSWYYHNGTTWVAADTTYAKANTLTQFNAKAMDFAGIVGRATTNVYLRALLGSDGTTPCEINTLTMGGNTSY